MSSWWSRGLVSWVEGRSNKANPVLWVEPSKHFLRLGLAAFKKGGANISKKRRYWLALTWLFWGPIHPCKKHWFIHPSIWRESSHWFLGGFWKTIGKWRPPFSFIPGDRFWIFVLWRRTSLHVRRAHEFSTWYFHGFTGFLNSNISDPFMIFCCRCLHLPQKSTIHGTVKCLRYVFQYIVPVGIHPGRLTAGTYSHHPFRKENDLNQTSMIMFQPLIFRVAGLQSGSQWSYDAQ